MSATDKSEHEDLVAVTPYGLETVCAEEITRIGGYGAEAQTGIVRFVGDLYESNLRLRTAMRVLRPLREFTAANPKDLYAEAARIRWPDLLTPSMTLAVDARTKSEIFRSGRYVGQVVKDAAVDSIRRSRGDRPSVNPKSPDVRVNVSVSGNKFWIALDSSDPPLYRRGYRQVTVEAPMNECLAAGILRIAGFSGRGTFVDPMCGSGTLAVEAAMVASGIAPGLLRESFGFFTWRDFDSNRWNRLRRTVAAESLERPSALVVAADRDGRAVDAARRNARTAGVAESIRFLRVRFDRLVDELDPDVRQELFAGIDRLIVMNPPYGERMSVDDEVSLYRSIGDTLKQNFPGFTAWVITGSSTGRKSVGLRHSQSVPLFNGPIECRLRRYEISP